MVSSVTSIPYFSYLTKLQGNSSSSATNSSSSTTTNSNDKITSANGNSAVSALLGSKSSGFSPEVLSLLQSDNSGSFDPISSLLGGTSTNNATTSLYSNIFSSSLAASLQKAQNIGSQIKATTQSPISNIDNIVNDYTQRSIAYNQTLIQNTQAIVAKTTDITSLIA